MVGVVHNSSDKSLVSSYVIEVPINPWHPKPEANYHPVDAEGLADELFIHVKLGKSLVNDGVEELPPRDDLILWDDSQQPFLDANLTVGNTCDPNLRARIISIIKQYWDAFDPVGVRRPVRGIVFHVDTGDAQPICVQQPLYGYNEAPIMQKQVDALEHNGMIKENNGPWAFKLVLAPKPHQESCTSIVDFIWRLCVNFRRLNQVTKPFKFWIPRCAESLELLNDSKGPLCAMTLDADSGFHQIDVTPETHEKLSFWGPDGRKMGFLRMPFGVLNGSPIFQFVISKLIKRSAQSNESRGIPPNALANAVYVLKSIIDDILLVTNCPEYALQLLECLCEAAVHFRLTIKLKKCVFFKDRLEWMGYDWTPRGNVPAESKFDLIRQWAPPKTSQALNSFVSFCGFYRNFLPWYEVEVGPLRKLARQFKHAPIPAEAWTPALIALFDKFKAAVTASPCLARADASKPFFLRTDWAKTGFAAILLQPDDSSASQAATAQMERGEPCVFDKTLNGARLRPVRFLARKCDEIEEHYHSMVGEAACGRWGISKLRYYLWGRKFYWITDCSAIKAMIEYDGDNHLLRRWAMDLLGYSFEIIHRPERMMKDVDALSRHYDPLVREHVLTAHRLREEAFVANPSHFTPVPLSRINAKGSLIVDAATESTAVHVFAHVSLALTRAERTDPKPASAHSFCTILASRGKRAEAAAIAPTNSIPARLSHLAMTLPISSLDTERDGFMPSNKTALETCASNFLQSAWISLNSSPASASSCLDTIAPACTLLLERTPERLALATMVSPQCVARLCPNVSYLLEQPDVLHGFPTILGYDATFSPNDGSPEAWLSQQLAVLPYLRIRHALRGFLLFIPLSHDPAVGRSTRVTELKELFDQQVARLPQWHVVVTVAAAHELGDNVWRETIVVQGLVHELAAMIAAPNALEHPRNRAVVSSYGIFLDDYYNKPSLMQADVSIAHISPAPQRVASEPFASSSLLLDDTTAVPILDPSHPACISPVRPGSSFSSSFAVPVSTPGSDTTYRPCSPLELFAMLSMESSVCEKILPLDHFQQVLLLQECAGYRCLASVLCPFAKLLSMISVQQALPQSSPHAFPTTCLTIATQLPTPDDWLTAYNADRECSYIIDALANNAPWNKQALAAVDPLFRPLLRENQVSFVNNRLICLKPVIRHQRALQLIIVPESLRRRVFEAYHSTPCAGHMGDRKTFLRLRLRFLWPNMKRFVEQACKHCPECLLANAVHRPSSTLLHGTILEQPMALLHIDAYAPGATTSFHDGYTGLLSIVCDLTGFAVVVPFKKASASEFARLFCSEVLFLYGICSRVVIDDDSKFKGFFQDMCIALKIEHIVLARGNHQGCRCERFHRYLNKVLTIECTKRRTNRIFVDGSKTATYAWNAMPIDGTDIVRSYVVCGRVFRFPIEISMDDLPEPVDDSALSVQRYLSSISEDHALSQEILKLLVEDRRTVHRERINESRTPRTFQVGDKVAVGVQVQSDASKGQVGKLVYDFKGPYVVVNAPGHDSYDVRRLDQPDGAIRHLKGSSLLPMPPKLEPCYPIDSIDYRFLNQDRTPVLNPLKDSLGIDSYNYLWLESETPPAPSSDDPQPAIPAVVSARNPFAPSIAELYNELLHPSETQLMPSEAPIAEPHPKRRRHFRHDDPSICCEDPAALFEAIQRSRDKLFFVSFVAEGTIHPKLYIVRADPLLSARSIESSKYKSSGIYYCEFLASKQSDDKLPWNERRWRTEWRKYTLGTEGLAVLSEGRYEFPPQRIPDSSKYIAFASTLNLTEPSTFVYGPFDFESAGHTPSGKAKGRERIPPHVWARLQAVVEQRNDIKAPPLSECHAKLA